MHELYDRAVALTDEVIAAAVKVQKRFGIGVLESTYVKCLEHGCGIVMYKGSDPLYAGAEEMRAVIELARKNGPGEKGYLDLEKAQETYKGSDPLYVGEEKGDG